MQKISTERALTTVERAIDRSRLRAEEIEQLDWHFPWIQRNDSSWRRAHNATWKAGVFGFAGIGIANLLLSVFAYRVSKKASESDAS